MPKISVCSLLLAALLGGCASAGGPEAPRSLQSLPSIEIGKTTMNDLRARLGPPASTGRMPFKELTWWEYPVTDAMQVDHLYSVYFSPDGIARQTGMVRHPKYDTPGGYQ